MTNRPEILDLWISAHNRATWDVTICVRTYETINRDPIFTPNNHDKYRFNLTDLLRTTPAPTEDERFEYHERKMLEHTEQVERLRPGAEPRRDEAVRLTAEEIERLKYARDCVLSAHDTWFVSPEEWLARDRLTIRTRATLDRLIASKPAPPALTAEDLRELQRALDAWRQETASEYARRPLAHTGMRLLDRLDAEGKLGRSGR